MKTLEEIVSTDAYKNHLIKMAMCDFGSKAPTMYYDKKPMIIGKNFKSNVTDIPDKYENNKEAMSIYNDLIEFLEKRGYQNKPVKLKRAYGIKSYYELCDNEKFTQRFNQDKENIKQELEPIQKKIELCEAFS